MKFTRITVDARQMDGVPSIRGLRIPVATVINVVADGMTHSEILNAYPDLHAEDIHEALRFGGSSSRARIAVDREVIFLTRRPAVGIIANNAGAPALRVQAVLR